MLPTFTPPSRAAQARRAHRAGPANGGASDGGGGNGGAAASPLVAEMVAAMLRGLTEHAQAESDDF